MGRIVGLCDPSPKRRGCSPPLQKLLQFQSLEKAFEKRLVVCLFEQSGYYSMLLSQLPGFLMHLIKNSDVGKGDFQAGQDPG